MKKVIAMCVGLAATVLFYGCVSVRVETDLLPGENPELTASAGRFYVAGLRYCCDDGLVNEGRPSVDVAYEKRLFPLVRKECELRYPGLFSSNPESAIPIIVAVEEEHRENKAKMIGWMLGTLCIAGTVLPGPGMMDIDRNITVSASRWNGVDNKGSRWVKGDLYRREIGWVTLLTPLGLIPIPGESDFPKASTAFHSGRLAYDDAPQLAMQVATLLATILPGKDAAFWTAPPFDNAAPPNLATQHDLVPSVLPLPTESMSPF